ncbi:MAG: NAD(P)/FAD-dependent oxidoreductase [Chloroflexaceae bacterium]|nr:NAD(P)/FAD-dependent oxidoreductase [Chloroflexaceae bacterium]
MYDVLVLGGGPAGVVAALRARELGASVALVERGRLGGSCINDGCVPMRGLAKAARLVRDAAQCADYGLTVLQPRVNFRRLLEQVNGIVSEVHDNKELAANLRQAGVELFEEAGAAAFTGEHRIALANGTTLEAEKFIICTGGQARRLPFPGSEHTLTASQLWSLPELPRSVVVVGGAATGCQLASVLAAFGSSVMLIDVNPTLLASADEMLGRELTGAFQQRGIEVVTGIGGIERVEREHGVLRVIYSRGGETFDSQAEAVFVAAGWPGNTEELNLAAAHVRTERGYIVVDEHLQSSVPHIFAAGDVNGRTMLVQSADHQGRIAAENAVLGASRSFARPVVPYGGFTDPEYASVGLTEAQARAAHNCAITIVPYTDLDRAVIDGRTRGAFTALPSTPGPR